MAPSAFLRPFAAPSGEPKLTIVRGEGARVWDDRGRSYVDGLAALWYCQVGHGRAEIADAVARQLRTLAGFHCFDPYTNEPAERFAAALQARAPMPGARVFLTCSGSEAVDSAIKLARLVAHLRGEPDRNRIVARRHAYHGTTYGGTTAQGIAPNRDGFGPFVEGVDHVAHDDLADVARLFAARGREIAAVLAEPVIGAGGVMPPAPGYLDGLRRLCDEHGALLILDEVITGFGRLGRWWGAERFGVVPDLVTFAKGATSGYQPLGGVLVGRAALDVLEAERGFVLRHGHTYSGHPAACAAGLANLAILEREGLIERASHVGARLAAGLTGLARDGRVAEARGDGAVWAERMRDGVAALAVRDAMIERGVLCRSLPGEVVAFCPPLVIGDGELDELLDALERSLPPA